MVWMWGVREEEEEVEGEEEKKGGRPREGGKEEDEAGWVVVTVVDMAGKGRGGQELSVKGSERGGERGQRRWGEGGIGGGGWVVRGWMPCGDRGRGVTSDEQPRCRCVAGVDGDRRSSSALLAGSLPRSLPSLRSRRSLPPPPPSPSSLRCRPSVADAGPRPLHSALLRLCHSAPYGATAAAEARSERWTNAALQMSTNMGEGEGGRTFASQRRWKVVQGDDEVLCCTGRSRLCRCSAKRRHCSPAE